MTQPCDFCFKQHGAMCPSLSTAIFCNDFKEHSLGVDAKPTNPKDAAATDRLPLHLVSPFVKAYLSVAAYLGATKYGAWNWRAAGVRASVYLGALQRHVDAWSEGEENDPADGTPHLANALACLQILVEAQAIGKLIDDRPPSQHAALSSVRTALESMMPRIRAKYSDRDPKHWTIHDTV